MTWASDNVWWLDNARKRWETDTSDRLTLRAWLASPLMWDGYQPIMIEGALQAAVCLRESGRLPDDVYRDCPKDELLENTDIAIPIADFPIGVGSVTWPVACVSCGWFSPDAVPSTRYIRKRPDAELYGVPKVNLAESWSKATNQPYPTVTANYIEFFALGDEEKLRDLLLDVTHLGGARSGGLGRVHGWEVEIGGGSKQWPSFQRDTGEVMRPMPHGWLKNVTKSDTRLCTIRAPYWHKRSEMLCDVPVIEVGR